MSFYGLKRGKGEKVKKLLILGFITLFTSVLFNGAEATPLATTQVAKLSEVLGPLGYVTDQYDSGQQTYEQATASNLSVGDAMAEGYASAGFGPGIPQIGIASTSAQVSSANGAAKANFVASVLYFFEIQPIGPDQGISQIPVLFSANGQGTAVTGAYSTARTAGYVALFGNGVSYDEASFVFDLYLVENQSVEGNFNENTKQLNLYPSDIYGVTMSAVSETYGLSAGSTAEVDPFIVFDQSTFDAYMASMGQSTFTLNEYYRFVFSENLPLPPTAVPEPGILILLGLSMVSIAGLRRWWKD